MFEWNLIRNWAIKVIQRNRSDNKTEFTIWSRLHKMQAASGGDLLSLPIRPSYPKNEELKPASIAGAFSPAKGYGDVREIQPLRLGHGRIGDYYIPSFEELFP